MDLLGKVTADGWTLVRKIVKPPEKTGGYFSECYEVERGTEIAFLKALHVEKFSNIAELVHVTAGFQYEGDLLAHCKTTKLNRIVRVLESGHLVREDEQIPLFREVPFLIFERASGDIRNSIAIDNSDVSLSWRFFVLHQTTLALLQLHGQFIAHQDLKPSNVLLYNPSELKVADLGRSSMKGKPAPHDPLTIAGDRNYAPFEQRYGYSKDDWIERRLSTDLFHLGTLIVFIFTNLSLPTMVMTKLPTNYRPENWGETYEKVAPFIKEKLVESLSEIAGELPLQFQKELIQMINDLCDPYPSQRGLNYLNKGVRDLGGLRLQRFASKFDLMSKQSKIGERKSSGNHAQQK